jgi:hypothetical protein
VQHDELEALVAEIDSVLGEAAPRLPWVMSNDSHQRQLLARAREQLAELKAATDPVNAPEAATRGLAIDPTTEAASQVLKALLNEMQYLRGQTMQILDPLRNEVATLRQQRELLFQEVQELQQQRLQIEQQQALHQLPPSWEAALQQMTRQLEAHLKAQVSESMQRLEGATANAYGLTQLPPTLGEGDIPELTPAQRLAFLKQIQTQSDQLMLGLDQSLRSAFDTLQQSIYSYQNSLNQGLNQMHSLGRQGELMVSALVNHLEQQIDQETLAYLESGQRRELPQASPGPAREADLNDASLSDSLEDELALDAFDLDLSDDEITLMQIEDDISDLELDQIVEAEVEPPPPIDLNLLETLDAAAPDPSPAVSLPEAIAGELSTDVIAAGVEAESALDELYESLFGNGDLVNEEPEVTEADPLDAFLDADSPPEPELDEEALLGTALPPQAEAIAPLEPLLGDLPRPDDLAQLAQAEEMAEADPAIAGESLDDLFGAGTADQLLANRPGQEAMPLDDLEAPAVITSFDELLPPSISEMGDLGNDGGDGEDLLGGFMPAAADEDLLAQDNLPAIASYDLPVDDTMVDQLEQDLETLETLDTAIATDGPAIPSTPQSPPQNPPKNNHFTDTSRSPQPPRPNNAGPRDDLFSYPASAPPASPTRPTEASVADLLSGSLSLGSLGSKSGTTPEQSQENTRVEAPAPTGTSAAVSNGELDQFGDVPVPNAEPEAADPGGDAVVDRVLNAETDLPALTATNLETVNLEAVDLFGEEATEATPRTELDLPEDESLDLFGDAISNEIPAADFDLPTTESLDLFGEAVTDRRPSHVGFSAIDEASDQTTIEGVINNTTDSLRESVDLFGDAISEPPAADLDLATTLRLDQLAQREEEAFEPPSGQGTDPGTNASIAGLPEQAIDLFGEIAVEEELSLNQPTIEAPGVDLFGEVSTPAEPIGVDLFGEANVPPALVGVDLFDEAAVPPEPSGVDLLGEADAISPETPGVDLFGEADAIVEPAGVDLFGEADTTAEPSGLDLFGEADTTAEPSGLDLFGDGPTPSPAASLDRLDLFPEANVSPDRSDLTREDDLFANASDSTPSSPTAGPSLESILSDFDLSLGPETPAIGESGLTLDDLGDFVSETPGAATPPSPPSPAPGTGPRGFSPTLENLLGELSLNPLTPQAPATNSGDTLDDLTANTLFGSTDEVNVAPAPGPAMAGPPESALIPDPPTPSSPGLSDSESDLFSAIAPATPPASDTWADLTLGDLTPSVPVPEADLPDLSIVDLSIGDDLPTPAADLGTAGGLTPPSESPSPLSITLEELNLSLDLPNESKTASLADLSALGNDEPLGQSATPPPTAEAATEWQREISLDNILGSAWAAVPPKPEVPSLALPTLAPQPTADLTPPEDLDPIQTAAAAAAESMESLIDFINLDTLLGDPPPNLDPVPAPSLNLDLDLNLNEAIAIDEPLFNVEDPLLPSLDLQTVVNEALVQPAPTDADRPKDGSDVGANSGLGSSSGSWMDQDAEVVNDPTDGEAFNVDLNLNLGADLPELNEADLSLTGGASSTFASGDPGDTTRGDLSLDSLSLDDVLADWLPTDPATNPPADISAAEAATPPELYSPDLLFPELSPLELSVESPRVDTAETSLQTSSTANLADSLLRPLETGPAATSENDSPLKNPLEGSEPEPSADDLFGPAAIAEPDADPTTLFLNLDLDDLLTIPEDKPFTDTALIPDSTYPPEPPLEINAGPELATPAPVLPDPPVEDLVQLTTAQVETLESAVDGLAVAGDMPPPPLGNNGLDEAFPTEELSTVARETPYSTPPNETQSVIGRMPVVDPGVLPEVKPAAPEPPEEGPEAVTGTTAPVTVPTPAIPPTPEVEAFSPVAVWFLGLDVGTTGLSAVLLERRSGQVYPIYWVDNTISGVTADKFFRLPSLASVGLTEEADDYRVQSVGSSALTVNWSDGDNADQGTVLLKALKPYLKLGIPSTPGESAASLPQIQWSDTDRLPLQIFQDGLQALLATVSQGLTPESTFSVGAVGLETEAITAVLDQLQGVVVSYPANWPDTYTFNLREAVLGAGLAVSPDDIYFVEDAIAAVLSGLPDPATPLPEGNGQPLQQQTLYACPWTGGTVVISAGATVTEVGIVNLPRSLGDLTYGDFALHSMGYAGDAIDLDIICHLLHPAERRQSRPGEGYGRNAGAEGWGWQTAMPELEGAQWADLDLDGCEMPRPAEPDLARRQRLYQRLETSLLGQSVLEAARHLKIILQHQPQFELELADQRWVVRSKDLEDRIILPYIQRINGHLNRLLSEGGLTSQGINQVICTGGSASLPKIARWLRQKFPNATIVQDTYHSDRPPSCSRVTYGLVNLVRYPQVLDLTRHQYSDMFLLMEVLRTLPEQPMPLSGILHLLKERGLNVEACQAHLLALLEGRLPPGLLPSTASTPVVLAPTSDDLVTLSTTPLFTHPSGQVYVPNLEQGERLRTYMEQLLTDKHQNLVDPLLSQLAALNV